MTDAITIRANPTIALPNGSQRYSGAVLVGENVGARMTLDVTRPGIISPSMAVATMLQPEAEAIGLGRGEVERIVGAPVTPGGPLSREWFAKLIEHPSTAAILATTTALPASEIARVSFAARVAQHVDDAITRRFMDRIRAGYPNEQPSQIEAVFGAAARDATAELRRHGWNVTLTAPDLARALKHRRLWINRDPVEVAKAVAAMSGAFAANSEINATALSLYLAAFATKGIPCSCQKQAADPIAMPARHPLPPLPTKAAGCACKLQSMRK